MTDAEIKALLNICMVLFCKYKQYPQALRAAMQLGDHAMIVEIFTSCPDV